MSFYAAGVVGAERKTRSPSVSLWVLAAALLLAAALAGCDRIGGRTVFVELRSAEGIGSGRPVYVAGVEVGRTGPPAIVEGKAHLPVRLWRRQQEAVGEGTVFAIAKDPSDPGQRCLVAHTVRGQTRRVEDGTEIYPGVASEFELALIIGAEKAKDIWEAMPRL